MNDNKVYGIDLGTTYSCISYVDEFGKAIVVPNKEGQLTTPSVVYFESSENIVVGETAKGYSETEPDKVVQTVKRVMGDPTWTFNYEGKSYTPQEISAFILKKLIEDAQSNTGDTINDVVITVPAYFGANQREATKQAGQIAGLNVLYVVPEPTAAAISYGLEGIEHETVLVYDLGGGTFDITLCEITSDGITVILTDGNHDLGGKNWDETIAQWLAQTFADETENNVEEVTEDKETWQELLNEAEKAKYALSSATKHKIVVRFGGDRAPIELTREKFDELTSYYLQLTLSLTDKVINEGKGKGYETIDKILLVGGSTYMPQVEEALKSKFSEIPLLRHDPNQAVAKGAALLGLKYRLENEIDGYIKEAIAQKLNKDVSEVTEEEITESAPELKQEATKEAGTKFGFALPGIVNLVEKKIQNVTSKGFGVGAISRESGELVVVNLIGMNDPIPVEYTEDRFGTQENNQVSVIIPCFENTFNKDDQPHPTSACIKLGEVELEIGTPLPEGSPIEVTFTLSSDGLLSVRGREPSTGREISAVFKTESVLSEEEIAEKQSQCKGITIL